MTQQEECLSQGKNLESWDEFIRSYFDHNYDSFETKCRGGEHEKWFCLPMTPESPIGCFHLNTFAEPLCGFIIEYADSENDIDLIRAEDGDQYPLLDYKTPDDMLQAMLKEIEG
ncbi:MAG: hypothetical protein Q4D81_11980 [Eubacteriales bacterium]|nr:hypothetical protein [Eubacteriales bacterium]